MDEMDAFPSPEEEAAQKLLTKPVPSRLQEVEHELGILNALFPSTEQAYSHICQNRALLPLYTRMTVLLKRKNLIQAGFSVDDERDSTLLAFSGEVLRADLLLQELLTRARSLGREDAVRAYFLSRLQNPIE